MGTTLSLMRKENFLDYQFWITINRSCVSWLIATLKEVNTKTNSKTEWKTTSWKMKNTKDLKKKKITPKRCPPFWRVSMLHSSEAPEVVHSLLVVNIKSMVVTKDLLHPTKATYHLESNWIQIMTWTQATNNDFKNKLKLQFTI